MLASAMNVKQGISTTKVVLLVSFAAVWMGQKVALHATETNMSTMLIVHYIRTRVLYAPHA